MNKIKSAINNLVFTFKKKILHFTLVLMSMVSANLGIWSHIKTGEAEAVASLTQRTHLGHDIVNESHSLVRQTAIDRFKVTDYYKIGRKKGLQLSSDE